MFILFEARVKRNRYCYCSSRVPLVSLNSLYFLYIYKNQIDSQEIQYPL